MENIDFLIFLQASFSYSVYLQDFWCHRYNNNNPTLPNKPFKSAENMNFLRKKTHSQIQYNFVILLTFKLEIQKSVFLLSNFIVWPYYEYSDSLMILKIEANILNPGYLVEYLLKDINYGFICLLCWTEKGRKSNLSRFSGSFL